jgi:hypothetical protein
MAAANEFDMLLEEMSGRAHDMPTHHADLDKTTLGKTAVGAKPGTRVQIFPPASPSAMRGMTQVQVMQNTLQKYGVPSSPIQKLALTQLAATRDPSMKAQVREELSALSPEIQNKVRSLSKDVIVRAATLKKEDMTGITEPFGLWDPFGFTVDISEGRLFYYREAELKNGRTAMLAVLGIIVTDVLGVRPFYSGAEPYNSALMSHFTESMAKNFYPSLLVACGIAELFSYPDQSKAPGDLGFDPLGIKPTDEKEYLELQNKEINNGRLAMVAWAGIIGKELMTGEKVF